MGVEDQAKKIGQELKVLQEELSKDPKLTTLDKVRRTLKESENRLYSIQNQIDQANARLRDAVSEAEREARRVRQEAQDEARKLVQEAERLRETALKQLRDVEDREKAVEWVKAEDARLKGLLKQLALDQQDVAAARSSVAALHDLYTQKLQEVSARENAVAMGERQLPVAAPSAKGSTKSPK